MGKACNIVRFKIKDGCHSEFEELFSDRDQVAGEFLSCLVKTGDNSYCGFSLWDSNEALAAARPELIEFLDTGRHLLDEISPELGVTDPVSGEILLIDGIDWRSGAITAYAEEDFDFDYNEPPDAEDSEIL